jgi:hypothetical protein
MLTRLLVLTVASGRNRMALRRLVFAFPVQVIHFFGESIPRPRSQINFYNTNFLKDPKNGWLWPALSCSATVRLAYEWLIPWSSRHFLQKQPVSELSKKLPACFGTRRLNKVVMIARQWPLLEIASFQIKLCILPVYLLEVPPNLWNYRRWSVTNPSPLKDRTSNMLKCHHLSDVIANLHSIRDTNASIKVSVWATLWPLDAALLQRSRLQHRNLHCLYADSCSELSL